MPSSNPDDYLKQLDPQILSSLNSEQLSAVRGLLNTALPKPAPKIVDLRFTVDLILSRFYVVLLVGKERRTGKRSYPINRINRIANLIAAIILLLGLNLMISSIIFLFFYLIKSALLIDIFPHAHLIDELKKLFL